MSRSLRVSASPSTAVPLPAVSWADLEEEMAELPAQPSLSLKTSLPDSPDGRSSQAMSLRATCTERHPRDSATCAVPHGLPATCSGQETPYLTRDVRRKPDRFMVARTGSSERADTKTTERDLASASERSARKTRPPLSGPSREPKRTNTLLCPNVGYSERTG